MAFSLARVVSLFMAFWIIVYILAYIFFLSDGPKSGNNRNEDLKVAVGQKNEGKSSSAVNTGSKSGGSRNLKNTLFDKVSTTKSKGQMKTEGLTGGILRFSPLEDPFVTTVCESRITSEVFGKVVDASVSVIIAVRNENKDNLLQTIRSVISNSGAVLKKIYVVDDCSETPVNEQITADLPTLIQSSLSSSTVSVSNINTAAASSLVNMITMPHRVGVAGAKSKGADAALNDGADVLVFLDGHTIVSQNWLYPLSGYLNKHPNTVVYPTIDVIDVNTGDLIKAHNVVGAFDWSLQFQWEPVTASTTNTASNKPTPSIRMPLLPSEPSEDDELSSPASPGIFAMKAHFFRTIGGIDTSLKQWGLDSVELSIRTWLCGGSVVRQPCSRVAHLYDNLYEDSKQIVNEGVLDANIMTVAEHWLSSEHREIVYRARFLNRLPYRVIIPWDARLPKQFASVQMIRDNTCQDFKWFLEEVYPGLIDDVPRTDAAFRSYIASPYLEKALDPLIKQYSQVTTSKAVLSAPASETERMKKLGHTPEEARIAAERRSIEPKPIKGRPSKLTGPRDAPLVIHRRPFRFVEKSEETDPHERHANKVRESLMCEDEPAFPNVLTCAARTANGNYRECDSENTKSYMMFGCPKSCGFCDSNGKLCIDFYEHKCPQWKLEGKCESEKEHMHHVCAPTCGVCTRLPRAQDMGANAPPLNEGNAIAAANANAGADAAGSNAAPVVLSKSVTTTAIGKIAPGAQDPYVAQRDFANGALADTVSGEVCKFKGLPHGQILDRITFPTEAELVGAPRVFCGIYTMENNHGTNTKATRETWAKRCDGFVAFSTASDPTIPAYKIEHEGEESYDNMWQKSRSIWKYIAANYVDAFDFFLLGGDDMFYIIENLKRYLSSSDIKTLRTANKGMYLGRRFFPPGQEVFNSGGAGYILDQTALRILAANIDQPHCYPHQKGFWEDVNVANCLRQSAEIRPIDTRDALERERFHPFTPGQHLTYRIPTVNPDWYPKYNPYLKEGLECCSLESISFHYCPHGILRDLYTYLYHCDKR